MLCLELQETCARPSPLAGGAKKPPKPPARIAAAADDEPQPFGRPLFGYQPRGVE